MFQKWIAALLLGGTIASAATYRVLTADFIEGVKADRQYIGNSHFEKNVKGWTPYADLASETPTDCSGGSPTLAVALDSGSPLRGASSAEITKDAADRQGEGIAYDFKIDRADLGKKLTIEILDTEASANFVTGDASDLRVFIYNVDSLVLEEIDLSAIRFNAGKFVTEFLADDTDDDYRLCLHVATTNASAWTWDYDTVSITPQEQVNGTPSTSTRIETTADHWKAVTSDPNVGNVGQDEFKWWRVGEHMYWELSFRTLNSGGNTDGTGNYFLDITEMTGLSIDTAFYTESTNDTDSVIGNGVIANTANALSATSYQALARVHSANGIGFAVKNVLNTYDRVSATQVGRFGTLANYQLTGKVKILGWTNGVTMTSAQPFLISSVIANGTRVTADPDSLGEYRTLIKDNAARTFSDTDGSDKVTTADGMRIYSVNGTGAGTSTEPNRWEIYIGPNKSYQINWYRDTGRTGRIDTQYYIETEERGVQTHYDQTSGILMVTLPVIASSVSRTIGFARASGTAESSAVSEAYFDVLVSDAPQPIGLDSNLVSVPGEGRGFARYSIEITNPAGTPINNQEYGNWVDSITDAGVGRYDLVLTSGAFSDDPHCGCVVISGGARNCNLNSSPTTSTVALFVYNSTTGTAADSAVQVKCWGPK